MIRETNFVSVSVIRIFLLFYSIFLTLTWVNGYLTWSSWVLHANVCTYSHRHAHTLTRATVETAAAPPHHQPQGTTKDHIGDQPQPGRDTISLSVLHGTWEQTQLLRSRQAGLRRGELSLIQKDESVLNLSGNSLQPHLGSCLVTHSRDTLGVRHL